MTIGEKHEEIYSTRLLRYVRNDDGCLYSTNKH
jgi:hypothetical protein